MTLPARQFDVVVVPVPFAEGNPARRRPAVVVSSDVAIARTGVAVAAMVTRASAAPWHGDVGIEDVGEAGLYRPSKVRLKLHTIAARRLEPPIGQLAVADCRRVMSGLRELFAL